MDGFRAEIRWSPFNGLHLANRIGGMLRHLKVDPIGNKTLRISYRAIVEVAAADPQAVDRAIGGLIEDLQERRGRLDPGAESEVRR